MSKVEITVKRAVLEKKKKTSSGYKLGFKSTTLAVPRIFSKKSYSIMSVLKIAKFCMRHKMNQGLKIRSLALNRVAK